VHPRFRRDAIQPSTLLAPQPRHSRHRSPAPAGTSARVLARARGAMFLNPFGWGKKRQPSAEEAAAKATEEAALAARAAEVKREEDGDAAARTLQRQLRGLGTRIDDTLKKMDLLEKKRDEQMVLLAAASEAGSEARKKMHWRNKKRAEDEIKSLTAHMGQLEDMRSACEKRLSQMERQGDLEEATVALGKAKIDVAKVEEVMEEAKVGVENVADVEMVMNGFQLSDDAFDDDEMEKELAEFAAKKAEEAKLTDGEVVKLVAPKVPEELPAEEVEDAEFKRLEKEIAM
jgi:Snf7